MPASQQLQIYSLHKYFIFIFSSPYYSQVSVPGGDQKTSSNNPPGNTHTQQHVGVGRAEVPVPCGTLLFGGGAGDGGEDGDGGGGDRKKGNKDKLFSQPVR